MNMRVARVLIVVAACLTCLGGCSSSTKVSDLWTAKDSGASSAPATGPEETTGSVVVQPAEPGPSGEPATTPTMICNSPKNISAATITASPKSASAAPSRSILATPRPGLGLRHLMTGCTASISPTVPTKRPSASSGRRRKSSITRDSPICCVAITRAPTRSSTRRKRRTPPTLTLRPICACSKTATEAERRL